MRSLKAVVNHRLYNEPGAWRPLTATYHSVTDDNNLRAMLKGHFIYSAKPNFRNYSKRFILYSWQTCSIEYHLVFSGKHQSMLQLMRKYYLYTIIHHCQSPGILTYSWTGAM